MKMHAYVLQHTMMVLRDQSCAEKSKYSDFLDKIF